MVNTLKRWGWIRSLLTLCLLLLTIVATGWTVGGKVVGAVDAGVKDAADEVFEERLEIFHDRVQPKIMEGVDARIQIHSLEESKKTQEAIGQIQAQISGLDGKIDVLLERGNTP